MVCLFAVCIFVQSSLESLGALGLPLKSNFCTFVGIFMHFFKKYPGFPCTHSTHSQIERKKIKASVSDPCVCVHALRRRFISEPGKLKLYT